MRRHAIALAAALAVLAACGDGRSARPAQAGDAPTPVATNGAITAQLLRFERDRDRVEARVRLENVGADAVELRNVGDTLTGFRCVVEGSSYSAESHRRDGTVAAAANLALLPPQTPIELDLRWSIARMRRGDEFDCTVVISNLFANGKKLPDISILVPGAHADDDGPEPEQHPQAKPGEKKQSVSL